MRVLVTGGAGFLGSWICEYLLSDGASVTCVDNFASGLKSNVSHLMQNENFRLVEHDISKPLELSQRFDLVMHLASRASPFEFEKYPIEILMANTMGTVHALEIARRSEARLLYASTSEVYGDPAPEFVPTPESYNGNVSTTGPRSCYDEAKRAGEAFVMAYRRQYGMDTRIVRIFNTYGPRMRSDDIYGRVVPRFIEQALTGKPITVFGTGEQTRSFTYVTDEVDGILRLAYVDEAEGEVVNIGNNRETRIIELAELIKRLTGSESEITFHPLPKDDPKRRAPDISKARRLLNWKPEVSLEEGLRRTIAWFEQRLSAK
ncbi:MAG: SDR family oxidoreductase [Euryarchaeota archaeon]|nr:SDR family oxidoreductase [Euryarchaeota archaeon]